MSAVAARPSAPADLEARRAGHLDVEQDQVRARLAGGELERGGAVVGGEHLVFGDSAFAMSARRSVESSTASTTAAPGLSHRGGVYLQCALLAALLADFSERLARRDDSFA